MRILVVSLTYVVGAYETKLDALAGTGEAEVALLCPAKWKFQAWSQPFVLEARYPNIKLYPANIWLFNGRNGAFLYPLRTVLYAFRDFLPDIIYIEQEVFSLSTFQVAVFARIFHIPLTVFCWENIDKPISFIRRWTRKFVLTTACLITPGSRAAAELIRKWGYSGRMDVLPEVGVDTGSFSPQPVEQAVRPFCIGFVGRLVYEKGVDLILDAARMLLDRREDCRLLVCGSGPYEPALRERATKLGLSDIVEWMGELRHEDVPGAIAKMDVLVLPSRTISRKWQEQFGHVLIEAMAMGVPVVGSSSGAIPEVIGRGDLIFPEEDAPGLAEILERIAMEPDYRAGITQYGLARVDKLFTNAALARRLLELFSDLSATGQP